MPDGRGRESVSIRSRLLGREIPLTDTCRNIFTMFQSAPGFWAGRYLLFYFEIASCKGFNPLPAFGPGDTIEDQHKFVALKVSIRSRLLGREIL